MNPRNELLIGCACLLICLIAEAGQMKPLLFATETNIVRYESDGKITLTIPSGISRDVWQLDNGNILFPYNFKPGEEGGVREVDPDGKIVWDFKIGGWVLSCQRLKNGNTLVGAAGQCALLVVDPHGNIVNKIPVKCQQPQKHALTMARQLANGNFLVVEEKMRLLREYDPGGNVVWEYGTPFPPFSVVRLRNGNTLFSGKEGLVELTPEKEIVWQLTKTDVEAMGPRWFAGLQILPNGNILVCNAGGKVPFFEVNREKQVIWQSPADIENAGSGHGICLTDFKDKVLR